MPSNYPAHLERLGVSVWTRRLAVLILGALLAGNLAVMTFAWAHHPDPGNAGVLVVLWILSLAALFMLARLWRVTARSSAPPGGPQPNGNTSASKHHP